MHQDKASINPEVHQSISRSCAKRTFFSSIQCIAFVDEYVLMYQAAKELIILFINICINVHTCQYVQTERTLATRQLMQK